MARKTKSGLSYFPFDVDFFNDDKIELVSSEFGMKGEIIAIRLLCHIYRDGYYYKWGKDESLLFAKRVGNGLTGALVEEVVNGLVRRSFFDKRVFDKFSILTSRGIQQRYLEAKERAKNVQIIKEYSLIDINVANKHQNVTLIPLNVNTGTQKKGEESKVNESNGDGNAAPPKPKTFKQWTKEDFIHELEQFKEYYPKEQLNKFFKYWSEKSASGKMKLQLETTWETSRRLDYWINNDFKKAS